jgi:hypothetical protein
MKQLKFAISYNVGVAVGPAILSRSSGWVRHINQGLGPINRDELSA